MSIFDQYEIYIINQTFQKYYSFDNMKLTRKKKTFFHLGIKMLTLP